MATPVYHPKIKVDTVKGMAQKLASTKAGKSLTSTGFKKFLKSDKDLRSMTYKEGSSHITQQQAQKFLGKVAQKIKENEKMKLSMFARKIGVRSSSGEVSTIGVKHAYQEAAHEELAAAAPAGPAPEDVERQQRIADARKLLRQRERADEVRKEQAPGTPGTHATAGTSRTRTPQLTPVTAGQASGAGRGTMQNNGGSRPPVGSSSTGPSLSSQRSNAAVLPIRNLSQMRELSMLATKLEETIRRAVALVPSMHLHPRVATMKTLQTMGWREGRTVTPEFSKKVARKLELDFIFSGTIAHERAQARVRIYLVSVKNNVILLLAEVWEDTFKTFEIEEKVSWQIQNFFNRVKRRDLTRPEVKIPSASEAVDLPI